MKLLGSILGGDEIHLPIIGENGQKLVFVFAKMDARTHTRANDILFPLGRKKGNRMEHVKYLFRHKCMRVEGLSDEEKAFVEASGKTIQQLMLEDDDTYFVLIDRLIGEYNLKSSPDVEDSKSPSESD